ncbi:hypothetical protein [Sphingomonas asaccharolytica]|uniref:hypothetical protein n=1 Tax=Sphingomonas asaccharolytica TaxID=40681 RepID=UPI0008333502|nr:hypothetical protein [Sphingomonas asaccharolytica]
MSTIFWSWQSDLDARVTRNLIRDALAAAIDDLHAELDERHELTSDTQGVAGSPDIVATILAKIDSAAVFVGDVTPIAVAISGKAVANPNVLIELGYAKKALGLARVIMVWNTAFEGATIDRLPFDMRGRRAPVSFHLPVGATLGELRSARDNLRKVLREALRLSIADAAPAPVPEAIPEWQPSGPTSAAFWFDDRNPLTINEGGIPGSKAVHAGPYGYVRILPRRWTAGADFAEWGRYPKILGDTEGFSWGMTRGGQITYSGSLRAAEKRPLTNFVMHFKTNGEIWGVTPFVTDGEPGGRFFADAFIRSAYQFIEANIGYLGASGANGPYDVRMGLTDISSMRWTTPTEWGGRPVALEESAEAKLSLASNTEEEILVALDSAWGQIAEAFGLPQPPRSILVKQIRGF